MYVHLKQSGELLTDRPGALWSPDALYRQATRIQELQQRAGELSVQGIMIVPGAGNIVRGETYKELFGDDTHVTQFADAAGRKGTEQNALMLSGALTRLDVPHRIIGAPKMGFSDIRAEVEAYTPDLAMEAYQRGEVILIAGGSGKDGQTTDAAVMDYALWHGEAFPDTESIAMKATKHVRGIYNMDPRVSNGAKLFSRVSAAHMLEGGIRGVDERCLELIAGAMGEVELLVYNADCSPVDVLQRERAGDCAGTIISSKVFEPQYAEAFA